MSNIGYQTVEYWDSNIGLSSLFSKVGKFKDIGFGPQELYEYFTLKFFDRPMARPFDNDNAAATVEWYKKMVGFTVTKNAYKYDTLLGTIGLDYNPIENYRMVELSGEFAKHGGSTQTNRAEETTAPTTDVYTTQYNNDTPVLAGSTKNHGQTTTTLEHEAIDDTIAAKDNVYEKDVTNVDELGGKKLTRYGNIGVTTSQQMIESERELAYLDVIDEFLKDIKKEILLGIYAE